MGGVIVPGPEFTDIPRTRRFPLPDHGCVGGEAYRVPLPSPPMPVTFFPVVPFRMGPSPISNLNPPRSERYISVRLDVPGIQLKTSHP